MEFRKITLGNGLRIVLAPQAKSLSATVLILVEAGSEYETKNISGISHFLEHMTFKGTTRRPKPGMIAEELAALGAQSNAFTSHEYTGYWAKVESRKLSNVLDIVSDLYLNPIFSQEEIDKERGVIIEEINMYEDTPSRRVHDIFTTLLYGDQPAGWYVDGRKEVIRKLRRDDFVGYRSAHYLASRTVFVAAGNFDEKKVLKEIKARFGSLPRRSGPTKKQTREVQKKPGIIAKFKESDQSHMVLGFRGLDIFDKRRYAASVLCDVLGGGMSSRLFHRVREDLGAAYHISAGMDLYLDHGYLAVSAGIDPKRLELVVRVVLEEIRRLQTELVPAKEFRKSKDHLIGSMILGLETTDELAGFYGEQEILSKKILPPQRIVDRIERVKPEEIAALARDLFKNQGLNLAVIGPHKNDKIFKKILSL